MKYTLLFLSFVFASIQVSSQSLFTYRLLVDSSNLQESRRIIHTPDSNFLVVGYTLRSNTSLDRDALVFKISSLGTVLWAKRYGGTNWEELYDVAQVGNYYYCVGYTRSFVNGKYPTSGTNLTADIFLMKLNLDGTLVWAKNMGKPSNGSSSTDGNDIGLRLIASGQGGVVIVARINSGAGTNQNGGLIWVNADGTTKWAYQYDLTSNIANNELTFSIWKDKANQYITGGWIQTSGSPSFTGGIVYKVDQDGKLIWDKNIRSSPSTSFESLYYGYYNHKTQKIYSTDFYTQVSGTIREIQVNTNRASDGKVPTAGSIPQGKRFHYGTAGSSGNNFRSLIFPVGDGYEQFILAASENTGAAASTTKYATLISVDEELTYQWSKKIGATHSGSIGHLNQVFDMITCNEANQNLLVVGTITKSNGNKEILFTKVDGSSTLGSCSVTASPNNTSITETDSSLHLQRLNLNTAGCGNSCWADNDLISNGSISISNATITVNTTCGSPPPASLMGLPGEGQSLALNSFDEESNAPSNIVPQLNQGPNLGSNSNLSFSFEKQPMDVYFEMTNGTGDFVYQRFFGDLEKLTQGFNFASMNLPAGDYIWEIEAVYDDEQGIERKTGSFVME